MNKSIDELAEECNINRREFRANPSKDGENRYVKSLCDLKDLICSDDPLRIKELSVNK